jgi:hypothetical protein
MMVSWNSVRVFAHGIAAAFLSGSFTVLAAVVVTPDLHYKQLLHIAFIGGIVGVSGYFVKSPLKPER